MLVVDQEQGLALALAAIDHPADITQIKLPSVGVIAAPPALRIPTTYPTAMLFKIRRGRITRIEQIERPTFYGISSGWPK